MILHGMALKKTYTHSKVALSFGNFPVVNLSDESFSVCLPTPGSAAYWPEQLAESVEYVVHFFWIEEDHPDINAMLEFSVEAGSLLANNEGLSRASVVLSNRHSNSRLAHSGRAFDNDITLTRSKGVSDSRRKVWSGFVVRVGDIYNVIGDSRATFHKFLKDVNEAVKVDLATAKDLWPPPRPMMFAIHLSGRRLCVTWRP